MNDRLQVATRKGLFIFYRLKNGQWQPTSTQFIGEPVSAVLADPRDHTLYAALNLGHFGVKLWRSHDGGQEWEPCAVPVYPPQPASEAASLPPTAPPTTPDQAPPAPWSLEQIWVLEGGGADEPGVLWAGTLPGGLFRSADRGDSWELNRPLWDRPERARWMGGGYDCPGIHSICVDPRGSRHLTVAVSCGGVWQTLDGGGEWEPTTTGMHADYMPPERREDPAVQDPHRLAQCTAHPETLWVQHHNGIYRSIDGGHHWHPIHAAPSSFGFAVAVHPQHPDTAWFAPAVKDECRIPVDARLVVTRTRDGGHSFETLSAGLPPEPAYDLIYRHGLAVDDSGERLALGSTTGGLWLSEDGGEHWQCISTHLPPIYNVRFG